MVRNIWCIGRNYLEHAKELGNTAPSEPVVFLKAGSTLVQGHEIEISQFVDELHHEVELGIQFGTGLEIKNAAVGLDLTWRKKQTELKQKQLPWTLAKSFRNSCALGSVSPVQNLNELLNLTVRLKVNGEIRQEGSTSQMLFSLEQIVEFVARHFPVEEGDWILTGTPSGVGPLYSGDVLQAEVEGISRGQWSCVKRG